MEEKIKENKNVNNTEFGENTNNTGKIYKAPLIKILKDYNDENRIRKINKEEMLHELQSIFDSFKILAKVQDLVVGPSIITYEIKLMPGVSISKIKRIEADISLNLGKRIIKIEQIPNKSLLGIQVERTDKEIVRLGDIIDTEEFNHSESKVLVGLGQEDNGRNKIIDLNETSHILISGTTGSGKSMCIHSIINSIIYKASPLDVKLLMIDTKEVELSLYDKIPHLLIPVVNDYKKAIGALSWVIQEIENRYELFVSKGVRNFCEYNNKIKGVNKLSQIIILIDEFADLIDYNKDYIENFIYIITQKAKRVGIYIIIATERPSTNVVTGIIKANIPTRIAFRTFSKIDSKIILDVAGAEQLLGNGDMLYYSIGMIHPTRIQGSFVSEEQIKNIIKCLEDEKSTYDVSVLNGIEDFYKDKKVDEVENKMEELDPLLMEAIDIVVEKGQVSTSFLQREFKLGYARVGKIMDEMEELGVISGYRGSMPREVLINKEKLKELKSKGLI